MPENVVLPPVGDQNVQKHEQNANKTVRFDPEATSEDAVKTITFTSKKRKEQLVRQKRREEAKAAGVTATGITAPRQDVAQRIATQAMSLFMMVRNVCSPDSSVSMALFQDTALLWSAQGQGKGVGDGIVLHPPKPAPAEPLTPLPPPAPPAPPLETTKQPKTTRFYKVPREDEVPSVSRAKEAAVQTSNDMHSEARVRASQTFKKISGHYKQEVAGLQASVAQLRAENSELAEGGGKYAALMKENVQLTQTVQDCRDKISDLAELVSKCGEKITAIEAENTTIHESLSAPQKVEWSGLVHVFPDFLLAGKRTDDSIVKEVIDRVESLQYNKSELTNKNADSAKKMESLDMKLLEREDEVDTLTTQMEELEEKLAECEKTIITQHDELHKKRQITTLSVEETQFLERRGEHLTDCLLLEHKKRLKFFGPSKAVLSGLGKGRAVPSFLRYHGQVTNLYFDKKMTEDFIRLIWFTRDMSFAQRLLEESVASRFHELPPTGGAGSFFPAIPNSSQLALLDSHLSNLGALVDKAFLKRFSNLKYLNVAVGLLSGPPDRDSFITFSKLNYCNTVPSTRSVLNALPHLHDHIHTLLTETYDNTCECAYSLIDALDRYSMSPDIELFQGIITGEYPEQLAYELKGMIEKLKLFLYECDARYTLAVRGQPWCDIFLSDSSKVWSLADDFPNIPEWKTTGTLPGHILMDALENFFQNKEPADMKTVFLSLYEAVKQGHGKGVGGAGISVYSKTFKKFESAEDRVRSLESVRVSYKTLFAADLKYPENVFLEELKVQFLQETRKVASQVRQAFTSAAGINCGKTQVLLRIVFRNITGFDLHAHEKIIAWLDIVVRDSKATEPLFTTVEELPQEPYELAPILEKIRTVLYCRYVGVGGSADEITSGGDD